MLLKDISERDKIKRGFEFSYTYSKWKNWYVLEL